VADVFEECASEALASFTAAQMAAYIEAARGLGKLGPRREPMLVFLQEWPGWSRRARRCAGAGAGPDQGDAEVAQWRGHRRLPADPGPVARRLQAPSSWSFTSIWCAS
jgi:nitric oxide reductase NorD protein